MRRAAAAALALAAIAVWAELTRPAVAMPPAGASSSVVLHTYLRALVAGDCDTAQALAAPGSEFSSYDGDLCGHVTVTAFSVSPRRLSPSRGVVVYATTLTTDGSPDGKVPVGDTEWFYELEQDHGEWRIDGGGSGP